MASNPNKRIINKFWLLLLPGLLYSLLLWLGYDRLPLLPVVGDGSLIQDAALSLAHGQGLRAPSFEETLNFEKLYAHHPPVYLYLQSFIIRQLGLTPFSLRASSILFASLALAAWLACFGLALHLRWLDRDVFWVCCLLYLVEPTLFALGRWERMDSLANFLVASSLLLLMLAVSIARDTPSTEAAHPNQPAIAAAAQLPQPARTLLLVLSAVFAGLALATHIATVAAWLVWAFLIIGLRQDRSFKTAIVLILLPWLVFLCAWFLTYRSDSMDAMRQLLQIASHHSGGLLAYIQTTFLAIRNPRLLLQSAPLVNLVILAAWLIATSVFFSLRRRTANLQALEHPWFAHLWLGFSLAAALTLFFTGFNPKHAVFLFPFALLVGGIALRLAGPAGRRLKTISGVFASTIFAAAILVQALTFSTLLNEWNERSPDRFRKLAVEIPEEARVAAVPDFWYFFQSRNQPLRLIDYGFPEDREFWEANAAVKLHDFDFVLLYPDHPLSSLAAALSRQQQALKYGSGSYILYTIK
jgi:hypothetical protein